MANLCVSMGHCVNGVSKIHTDILKKGMFHDFYLTQPDKFIAIKTSKRTDGKGMIKIKRASTAPTPTAFPNAIEKNSFRFVSAIGPHPAPYKNAPLRDAAFFIFKLIQMAVYNRYSPIIFRWYYIT